MGPVGPAAELRSLRTSLTLHSGVRPVVAMGQLFMPVAGGIFKGNAHILAGPGLFKCGNPRCGTRRVSAGEGLGKVPWT